MEAHSHSYIFEDVGYMVNEEGDEIGGFVTLPSFERPKFIEPMKTTMHLVLDCGCPEIHEIKTVLKTRPEDVFYPDTNGCLPIHLLTRNGALFESNKKQVNMFAIQLLTIYPESILKEDNFGRIPFSKNIEDWVEKIHKGIRNHKLNDHIVSLSKVPRNVLWSILSLSKLMEQDDENHLHFYMKIAEHIAAIPFFVKTVLLIEDDNIRVEIMKSSLFLRVILVKETIGRWIIVMLKSGKRFRLRSLEYLELLSNSKIDIFFDKDNIPSPSEIELFEKTHDDLFTYIGNYHDFIPSLVHLAPPELERAGQTAVVRKALDKKLKDPFLMCFQLVDLVMRVCLLIYYKMCVQNDNDKYIYFFKKLDGKCDDSIIEALKDTQKKRLIICIIMCFYFFIRDISIALAALSLPVSYFYEYCLEKMHIINMMATIMTFASVIYQFNEINRIFDYLFSISIFLLWLSLLYFVRHIHKKTGLLLIELGNVFKQILGFYAVMFISVAAFGDLMRVYSWNTKKTCDSSDLKCEKSNVLKYAGRCKDAYGYCNRGFGASFTAAYNILLSEYDFVFSDSWYTYVSFVIFTCFLCFGAYYNLIASFVESYGNIKSNAQKCYETKRIKFASGQIEFQIQVRPRNNEKRSFITYFQRFTLVATIVTFIVLLYQLAAYTVIKIESLKEYEEFSKCVEKEMNRKIPVPDANINLLVFMTLFLFLFFIVVMLIFIDFVGRDRINRNDFTRRLRSSTIKFFLETLPCFRIIKSSIGIIKSLTDADDENDFERHIHTMVKGYEGQMIENVFRMEARMTEHHNKEMGKLKEKIQKHFPVPENNNDDDSILSEMSVPEFTKQDLNLGFSLAIDRRERGPMY